MRQSGRSAALWTLGFYALSLLAALALLACWPPHPYNAGAYKWQQLRRLVAEAPDRPLLVTLGCSRIDVLFQAGRLDGLPCRDGKPLLAYNFGVPAAGPAHELLYVRDMLEAGIRPRLLLVEVLPLLMNKPHHGIISEENWTSAPWRSLSQLLALWPYLVRPGHKCVDWLQARLAPWYLYRYNLQARLLDALFCVNGRDMELVFDTWGHQIPDGPSPAEIARRIPLTCHFYRPSLQRIRLGEGSRRALRDLLELCRREEVPVMLLITPEARVFRGWYAAGALAPAERLLAQLHDTYGVPVIDARDWVADKDFRDGHHVMPGGSHVFTTRLIEELRPRLLAPRGEEASAFTQR
jgi:hypothetical protein